MIRPPLALGSHPGRGRAAGVEAAVQVDADDPVPQIGAHAGHGCQSHTPALATTMSTRPMHSAACVISPSADAGPHVRRDQRGTAPERLDLLHATLSLFAHREVVDDDVGAVAREHTRDASAD